MPLFTKQQSQLEIGLLENVLPVGTLVYVTCYGAYYGIKGIIRTVDVIDATLHFYLVALQDGQISEPLWFVHDDIAAVEGTNSYETHSRLVDGHSNRPDTGSQTSVEPMQGLSYGKRQEAQDDGHMRRSQWPDTKMTNPGEVPPVETYKQLRGQCQKQIDIDKELIQKQWKIIQTRPERMRNHKKLIESNREYIENQKLIIQYNQERIELLKLTALAIIPENRKKRSNR